MSCALGPGLPLLPVHGLAAEARGDRHLGLVEMKRGHRVWTTREGERRDICRRQRPRLLHSSETAEKGKFEEEKAKGNMTIRRKSSDEDVRGKRAQRVGCAHRMAPWAVLSCGAFASA